MPDRLGIFAKYWQPGTVKTRLAAAIGDDSAAVLHRVFLLSLLARLRSIPQSKVLAFTPAERRAEFAQLVPEPWQLEPQTEGDLGQRMERFFQSAFARGFRRVVLIGSDSPTLPVSYVEQAFEQLASLPVVLGKSDDGGFYLVGATTSVPPMFRGVEWSTGRVWEQVMAALDAARVPVAQLPPWYDVDALQDLQRLAAELAEDDRDALRELTAAVRVALGTGT